MAKSSKKKSTKKQTTAKEEDKSPQVESNAWISRQTSLIVITLVSLAMGIYTGTQTIPALGWFEGLLWAVGYGGSIWLVFMLALLFNRYVRGRK